MSAIRQVARPFDNNAVRNTWNAPGAGGQGVRSERGLPSGRPAGVDRGRFRPDAGLSQQSFGHQATALGAPHHGAARTKANVLRTVGWFGLNVGTTIGTACLVGTLVPPVGGVAAGLASIAAIGFEIAALTSRSPRTQMASSLAFSSLLGVSIAQLAQRVGMAVMGTAATYTGALAGALMVTALVCPVESFAGWQGPMVGALVGLLCCSVATALMPASWGIVAALSLGQSIFGLGLFSAFTAYDVATVAEDAKRHDFNPVHRGMGIYLDVLNLFTHIVDLMVKQRDKK